MEGSISDQVSEREDGQEINLEDVSCFMILKYTNAYLQKYMKSSGHQLPTDQDQLSRSERREFDGRPEREAHEQE